MVWFDGISVLVCVDYFNFFFLIYESGEWSVLIEEIEARIERIWGWIVGGVEDECCGLIEESVRLIEWVEMNVRESGRRQSRWGGWVVLRNGIDEC